MLNFGFGDLEDFKMEEQVYLTITATVCASIFAVVWFSSALHQSSISHEAEPPVVLWKMVVSKEDWTGIRTCAVCLAIFYFFYFASIVKDLLLALMRKSIGLSGPEEMSGRQSSPIKLGPHSYMTLFISMGCCSVILFLIYLIRVIPFESLVKITPIQKLVRILINNPNLEEENEKSAGDDVLPRERILNTCKELEQRMARLEQCLVPLTRSLETLTQQSDLQKNDHKKETRDETAQSANEIPGSAELESIS